VGAVEGGAGEARGAKQCSVSFQLAPRIAANWKQMLMISVECPPATLGVVFRAGASWKHAVHWAASPPLARQPHPLLITPHAFSVLDLRLMAVNPPGFSRTVLETNGNYFWQLL